MVVWNSYLANILVTVPKGFSGESSEFNEVVQIDRQKICMTDSGYNQVMVVIDHFTKYAEAVPCITASAEETCNHLINTWISETWLSDDISIG